MTTQNQGSNSPDLVGFGTADHAGNVPFMTTNVPFVILEATRLKTLCCTTAKSLTELVVAINKRSESFRD